LLDRVVPRVFKHHGLHRHAPDALEHQLAQVQRPLSSRLPA
jgi:hypothetical protein